MGEYDEDIEWDGESESKRRRSGSVTSALGSVFGFSSSNEASLYSRQPSLSAVKDIASDHHHRLRSQSQSTRLQHKAFETTPLLRLTATRHQPHVSQPTSEDIHTAPTTTLHSPIALSRATSSGTLSPAPHHSFHFRKLPRAYRSPSSINHSLAPSVNQVEDPIATVVKRNPTPPISHSLLMASLHQPNDTMSRPDRNGRLMYTIKARGVVGLGSAFASPSAAIAEEVSPSDLHCGLPTTLCENVAGKPPPDDTPMAVNLAATSSMPVRPSTTIVSSPTSSGKARNKSGRFSFQLNKRPGTSSSDAATQSPKQDQKSSKRPVSRRRDIPRGDEYTVKLETVSKRGDLWDEEASSSRKMTMLPRWKAAFGRARGKSIEGDPPSSPLRRNVFASKSQTDLTRLQKLFREEASAESTNMPVNCSSMGYSGDRPNAALESPLVTAAREQRGKSSRGYPPSANRFDSSGRSLSRGQPSSCSDKLPSSPRQVQHTSSDQSLASHQIDGTSLQSRQKRHRLLRRPGTTQGPYTAPSTPSVRARPGTSGESSNRVSFHPASDPVISKRLIPVRLKKSSIGAPMPRSEQTTPERGAPHQRSWSRSGMKFEISPKQMQIPRRGELEKEIASRPCNSPLLQVLRTEAKPGLPSPSMSSPLFHSISEESQPSCYHQRQPLLLPPAQLLDPPAKTVSSKVKAQEMRRATRPWEDAVVLSPEEQQEEGPYDTPRSSMCRFTEGASSAGPATPYSSRSRQSTTSAHTFYCAGIDIVDAMPTEISSRTDGEHLDEGRASERSEEVRGKYSSFVDETGDQTIVPAFAYPSASRVSQQKSIFEQYCAEHPVNAGMLSPAGQESRRGSNDSRATVMCTTDSSASFSLDAEFWLVHSAEKKTIVASSMKSAALNGKKVDKEASIKEEEEETHADQNLGSQIELREREKKEVAALSRGVDIVEDKDSLTFKVKVDWETQESETNGGSISSASVLLSDADVDVIGRAWLRRRASRLSLLALRSLGVDEAVQSDTFESACLDERLALEQRQKEILKTSSEMGGIFRVRSAPAFVRRNPHCKNLALDPSSSQARKWQRKPLVLTPRIADQSTPIDDPLRSDGSTTRRYLISPQTVSSSSRPSSPNVEVCIRKPRSSRSPIGPAPLAYKRSISSFTNEIEISSSLPAT